MKQKKHYVNGEEITKEDISLEPWYSLYKSMVLQEDFDTPEELVKSFKEVWEIDGHPSNEILLRWAKVCIYENSKAFDKENK